MADRLSQLMSELQALLNGEESEPEDMQVIYDEEILRYSPTSDEGFGSLSPELTQMIGEMMMPGGTLKKGIGSILDDVLDLMKRGKKMGKTSVKRSKESEEYWDDASKRSRSDRIARENIEESRRSISEATTPEGTIRIERTINPKKGGWREDVDPSQKPPLKLKGGGHLYKKGYYGKSYR